MHALIGSLSFRFYPGRELKVADSESEPANHSRNADSSSETRCNLLVLRGGFRAAISLANRSAFTRVTDYPWRKRLLQREPTPRDTKKSRLKAGCTVESPPQPLEKTLGMARGRFPIGRRLANLPHNTAVGFHPFWWAAGP